jgi:hypothetical protein
MHSGVTVTNQNCMHEEINSKLNSGNGCCHAVQSFLPSRLLNKRVQIKIYKTTILGLPAILYGCETRSLTSWEEYIEGV